LCKCCLRSNNNNNNENDDMSQQEDIYMFQKYHNRLPADANQNNTKSSGGVASLKDVELNSCMGSTKSMVGKVHNMMMFIQPTSYEFIVPIVSI